MPTRPSRVPDNPGAGYRKLQRRLTRTVGQSDLHSLLPKLSRKIRKRYSRSARSIPLPALLGTGAALVVVAVVFLALAGAGSGSAGKLDVAVVDDARAVSLQVSGAFSGDGSFVHDPDAFGDPNADATSPTTNPLSRLLDTIAGNGSGGGESNGATAGSSGPRATPASRADAGAPAGILATPELVRLFDATNAERAANGLDPLILDPALNRSAQHHADWMGAHGVLCHSNECDSSGEPDPSIWNGWGENIASSARPTAAPIQKAFLESAPHRANMLDPRHHYIGLGWATGRLAGTDRTVVFVVVQFGMQRR